MYTNSAAFSPRGTTISYESNPSVGFVLLAEIKEINFSGAKYDLADVTNYESGNFREWLTTLADSGEVSFTGNYIPSDASQAGLLGFFNAGTLLSWQVTLPAGANASQPITFKAYVSSMEHNLPLDKEATITGKLKITGAVAGF
jgi:predicted secreted protein